MTLLALLLILAGALLLYLQSPQQGWLAAPLPTGPALALAAAALLAGLLTWQLLTAPVTGLFIALSLLMPALAAFPYLALLVRRPRRG